ncbi:primosomal replication protein N [Burkholderia sp. Ac-20379]|uniref:primosomal replication protein N n=1 Tax=Burkholderia sp. Ac-20379 TaxID=2703900 RepID=UPI00197E6690|nr:primosomal replication protein N [Burkholderia sp. Ac-20379]
MNRLQLTASVVERQAVRYTPAGVPIASCTLQHHTEVVEAGIRRQVELTIEAMAAGEASGKLERCEMGVETLFTGFLAKKHRNARTLVFHITALQDIGKD